jgi:endonuclease/exonuclease/phosphatase family metal-dependent hydrolase
MFKLFLAVLTITLLPATTVHAQSGVDDGTLRVMSYNIRIASPPSKGWGFTDLNAIAEVIKREKPDLIALQEVDAFTERSGKSSHQANELGALTGMYPHFIKAIDRSGGDYGVAILSKFPIISAESYRLTVTEGSDGEIRGCGVVVVKALGMKIGFMTAHLDHMKDEDRLLQVSEVNKILKKKKKIPVIFGADLNMERHHHVIRKLEEQVTFLCSDCEPTFPADKPDRTLDYVMMNKKALKKLKVKQYRLVEERYASDHLPLIVELERRK